MAIVSSNRVPPSTAPLLNGNTFVVLLDGSREASARQPCELVYTVKGAIYEVHVNLAAPCCCQEWGVIDRNGYVLFRQNMGTAYLGDTVRINSNVAPTYAAGGVLGPTQGEVQQAMDSIKETIMERKR